jgi:hypothetical protein
MRPRALRSIIVLGLLALAAGCGATEQAEPATLADAKALAAERGVPLLLDFFTEW